MKKLILLAFVIITAACGSEDPKPVTPATPTTPVTPNPNPEPSTFMGMFVSAPGESVKGNVKIVDNNGSRSLEFDETFMASGPDLKVYLSVDATASDYKSLGSLKSSSGTQTYAIPSTIDLDVYGKYVVVYCQQYSVLFGNAALK